MSDHFWSSEVLSKLFASESRTVSDLIELVDGEPSAFLEFADLRGKDLRGYSLKGVNLNSALMDGGTLFDKRQIDYLSRALQQDRKRRPQIISGSFTEPALPLLPFCYTLSSYAFGSLTKPFAIYPSPNSEFKNETLLLTYGRPDLSRGDQIFSSLQFSWPVILLFNPHAIADVDFVLPFSSSSFLSGNYRKYFDARSQIQDFFLFSGLGDHGEEAIGDILVSYVREYYGSNKSYLMGRSEINLDVSPFQFDKEGLVKLNRTPVAPAIEIGVSSSVPINSGTTLAIIAPQPLLQAPDFREILPRDAQAWAYEIDQTSQTSEFQERIANLIMDILDSQGFLADGF